MPDYRSNTNATGSHPMQRTMAARAAARARFAGWLVNRVNELGAPDSGRPRFPHTLRAAWLAERAGITRPTAADWLNGRAIPLLHQLPHLAQVLDVDLAVLCTATGRPPSDAVRLRYTTDTDGAIATIVHRWRTSAGLTHSQAEEVTGVSGGTLSRIESGQKSDISTNTLVALADAFAMSPTELAVACRAVAGFPEALDAAAHAPSQPLATSLRRARKARGLNPRQVALRLQISVATLSNYEMGRVTPSERTLLRAALFLGVSLARLLREAGYATSTAEAARLADALDDASRRRPRQSFAQSVTTARKGAKMPTYQLAARIGTNRFVMSRYEHGHLRPSEASRVVTIADALGVAPAPLLAAWSRTAA